MDKTKKPYLNQLIEPRRLTDFEEAYEKLLAYQEEHGLSKPNKGTFLSDIIGEGLKAITPEVFFNNKRS